MTESSASASTASTASLYPWLVAAMGLLVLFISNGFTATALSVFDESLLKEFGWDRGPFKFRDFISFAVTAFIAPFIGIVIDRVNPKWLLIIGLLLLSGGYFTYSGLAAVGGGASGTLLTVVALIGLAVMLNVIWTNSEQGGVRLLALAVVLATMAAVVNFGFLDHSALHQVYVIHTIFALALSTCGTMVIVVLVSSWFLRRRGLAIGIALLGTSMGGIILSPINVALIQSNGWRASFAYLSFLPLVLALLVLLFVRGTPKDAGAVALGQSPQDADLKKFGLTFSEAIRTPVFWAIGASGFLTYYSILALFNHLFLHMRGLGFEMSTAGKALAVLGTCAAISKLAIGALADYVDRKLIFLCALAVMFVGVTMLALLGRNSVWVAIVVVGLGWGGLFTLYNMLAVNNFGLKEFGRINGTISLLESLGGACGIWLTGVLFDATGDYRVPLQVIAGCVLLGFVIGLFIKSGSPEAMGLTAEAKT
jgi:predicted MFS family arabinose efflux permease